MGLAAATSAAATVPDPGALDQHFAEAGKATLDVQRYDYAAGVVVDAQGRIVVAGSTQATGSGSDFVIARYLPDGTLDHSFGTGGIVTTDFNGGDERAAAIDLDSTGRILVAGTRHGPHGGDYCVLARYRLSGELDHSFGHAGRVIATVGSWDSRIDAMAIDSLGRIVVGGRVYIPHDMYNYYDFVVARFTEDGELDDTFGRGGHVSTTFLGTLDEVHSLMIDSRGYIVAAGEANSYGESSDFALARYRPGGGLDTAFGDGGRVETSFARGPYDYPYDLAYAAAIDDEGRIVAAGASASSLTNRFALARYDVDGDLDPSFGKDGEVQTSFPGFAVAQGVVIDGRGRLVAAGTRGGDNSTEFALARYEPDGGLDASFGNRGRVTTPFGASSAEAAGVAMDARGRIVVAGTSRFPGGSDLAVARYIGRDKAPPDVNVKGHSRFRTRHDKRRARFRLKASEPVDFRCRIDGEEFHDCSSPYRTPRLGIGRHRLKVKATDEAGNTGADKKRFRIVARG